MVIVIMIEMLEMDDDHDDEINQGVCGEGWTRGGRKDMGTGGCD